MTTRQLLVRLSSAQLAAGLAGQYLALRDGRAFDVAILGWKGAPENVGRDSFLLGTGLSAPMDMLAAQALATARLARGPSPAATRTLTWLGVLMTCGYLVEREFREALSPAGWDPLVTPVAAAGLGLSVAMAVVGMRESR